MTVNTTDFLTDTATESGTPSYDFSFPLRAASDLKVYWKADAASAFTLQVVDTDYAISLNADQSDDPGGTVTPTSAWADGTLRLRRETSQLQTADLQIAQRLLPPAIEGAIDKVSMIAQEVAGGQSLGFRAPWEELSDPPALELPAAADRASKILTFDANGDLAAASAWPAPGDISTASASAATASAAAVAAAASATAADGSATDAAASAVEAASYAGGAPGEGTVLPASMADADFGDFTIASGVATIDDDAVTTAKIADDAVTTAKIPDDAVTAAKIPDDAITAAKIADDAVGYDQMAHLADVGVIGAQSAGAPALIGRPSAGELTAGTETALRAMSVADVVSLIGTHGASGVGAPTGAILWFGADSPPSEWLECDGSAVSRTTYSDLFTEIGTVFGTGDGSTTFNLPDLRGEFVRGWDNGAGVDGSRAFGSSQGDQVEAHTHTIGYDDVATGSSPSAFNQRGDTPSGTINTGSYGGGETRPRNVALLPCIKY